MTPCHPEPPDTLVILRRQNTPPCHPEPPAAAKDLSITGCLTTRKSVSDRQYFVYVLASRSRVLYVGVTNDLERRVFEHKQKLIPGFTAEYDIDRLIYFESTPDVLAAIQREKQLKGWKRSRKVALIESVNPHWEDLSFHRADEETPRRKARDPSLRSG